jgi:hypothetical protein
MVEGRLKQSEPASTMTAKRRWRTSGRSLRIGGCAVAVAALAVAGVPAVALGLQTSPRPVIYYACVTGSTGAIKIVSKSADCGAGKHKISWNNVGPKGSAGPRGPQGKPGVVTGYVDTAGAIELSNVSDVLVATLQLPLGKFEVVADVGLNTSETDTVQCVLLDSNGDLDIQSTTITPGSSGPGYGELTLLGDTTVGDAIEVQCGDSTATAVADPVTIEAIPVSKVVSSKG